MRLEHVATMPRFDISWLDSCQSYTCYTSCHTDSFVFSISHYRYLQERQCTFFANLCYHFSHLLTNGSGTSLFRTSYLAVMNIAQHAQKYDSLNTTPSFRLFIVGAHR